MGLPISSRLTAAESISNSASFPAFFTRSLRMYSPIVLRQILPWQTKSIQTMSFFPFCNARKCRILCRFVTAYHGFWCIYYFIIYFVPLPFPSIVITPFCSISFSSFVAFDFPKGTYGTISLIGFNIVLLKSL